MIPYTSSEIYLLFAACKSKADADEVMLLVLNNKDNYSEKDYRGFMTYYRTLTMLYD